MGTEARVTTIYGAASRVWPFFAALLALSGSYAGQQPAIAPAEMTTRESVPTFKIQAERNLVLVRVVVRDAKGNAIGDLRKEDFRLFDNGKPQAISHFGVERSASTTGGQASAPLSENGETISETTSAPSVARRYLGLYFDDVHAEFGDLARTREAADKYLAAALQPDDRAGVFTSSGQTVLDFTGDRDQLHRTLLRLLPHPIVPTRENACPEIFDYQAFMIIDRRDPFAMEVATQEALYCHHQNSRQAQGDPTARAQSDANERAEAQAEAEAEAAHVLSLYQVESEHALRGLDQLVRRVAVLPGDRNIVLVSPGFITANQESRVNEIVERALRSKVVINTFDAKGLFAPVPLGDASKHPIIVPPRASVSGRKSQLQIERLQRAADVLRTLAGDTGGEFFHDSNDYDGGFRRLVALPEVSYVLAFSPHNLKSDGRFHSLKVSLVESKGLSVQARRGYYAPRKPAEAAEQANEEVEQAVFSREELGDLPVDIHTQFFKLNNNEAKLSVLTRLDLHSLSFRKEEGRNLNKLRVVTAVFDRDGNYVAGNERTLELRLRDLSLERLLSSGIHMKTSFEVKPGIYVVRQVIRDAEQGRITGSNRTVEIPY